MSRISLIASTACSEPMTKGSTPRTPASAHDAAISAAVASRPLAAAITGSRHWLLRVSRPGFAGCTRHSASSARQFRSLDQALMLDFVTAPRRTRRVKEEIGSFAERSRGFRSCRPIPSGESGLGQFETPDPQSLGDF